MLSRIFIKLLLRFKKKKKNEDSHLTKTKTKSKAESYKKQRQHTHIEMRTLALNRDWFSKLRFSRKERELYVRIMKVLVSIWAYVIFICVCVYIEKILLLCIEPKNSFIKSQLQYLNCFYIIASFHLLTPFWDLMTLLESPGPLSQASSLPFDLSNISVCDG